MEYKTLGNTGLKVSRLCLGTMTFGWTTPQESAFEIMDAALAAGLTFFDTANVYSAWIDGNQGGESETIIGDWMHSRKNRREVIIASKVRGRMWQGENGEGLSRWHIIHAVEDSLRRLQTDYIDLYQTHWFDASTPIEETLYALDQLVRDGKVRYIGASNYPAWRLMKALWASDVHRWVRYESLQPHYSLLHRKEFEDELAEACLDQNVGVIPYSPLAAGFLTGKYSRDAAEIDTTRSNSRVIQQLSHNENAYNVLDLVTAVASDYSVPVSHVALAWLLTKPVITAPIIGARTLAQFNEVIGAVDLKLSESEVQQLDKISEGF